RENATLFMVCREEELGIVLSTMQQVEDQFNKNYHYPWVLLNNVEFSETFRHQTRTLTHAHVYYGIIPPDVWDQPAWIDASRAESSRKLGKAMHIPYGGFFYQHPLLQNYKYAWRVDPGTKYTCTLLDDPFAVMSRGNKTHGFVLVSKEEYHTGPTFWEHVYDFLAENPSLRARDNFMKFISEDGGDSYNFCRYRGSFIVTDMDFWRGDVFQSFFEYLDRKGGFYYERWSDEIVQTVALSLFASPDKVHFFDDVGFMTERLGIEHCPENVDVRVAGQCWCLPDTEFLRAFVSDPSSRQSDTFSFAAEDRESCFPRWRSALLELE
ncbi:alpha-1,2-mannosyltransferase, partial [Vararia minispora EC-137]